MGFSAVTTVWFVTRTQNNRERWAAENVARQGHAFYLPQTLETSYTELAGRRAKIAKCRPLFPSYLFVKVESGQWGFLTGTFGIAAVVLGTASKPATIHDSVIQSLRAREIDGMVQLPSRNSFKDGDAVRPVDGVFKGRIGIVEGMPEASRRKVLFDFLGRKTSILIAEAALEAA